MPCAYVMYGKLSRAERKTPPTARLGCRRLAVATATARLWCTPSASPACVAATCESPAARCSGAAVQRSRRRRLSPRTSTCRVRRCMRCSRCQNVRGGRLQRTILLEGMCALRGEPCRVTAAVWGNGDDRLRGVCVWASIDRCGICSWGLSLRCTPSLLFFPSLEQWLVDGCSGRPRRAGERPHMCVNDATAQ
jgi:hypothetical protein